MKRSQVIAASLLALFVVAMVPTFPVAAQSNYSEKLNVYVAGQNALWYMTFGGINGSSRLAPLEGVPGLSWYNVTAIRTSGWSSDFQVFGSQGYNLLPVPYTPIQGVFLSLGADSFADASSAAGALNSYLLTSFVSASNGTGVYSFYSPISFVDIVPKTLLGLVPGKLGGFASAITTTAFDSTSSPMVILEGVKGATGFTHSLVVGSITNKALDTQNKPAILSYFGSTVSRLRASNHSSSTTVQINTLDGIIRTHDAATVVNNTAPFSGSYTLTMAAGTSIRGINATVLQQPVFLLAMRTVNVGVLHTGQNLSVTVTLTNLSTGTSITNIAFSDNWWNSTGVFTLASAGNSTKFPTSLAPGTTVTPVYVLHYTGTTAGKLTIPASVVPYSFAVNSQTFTGRAVMNPIRLSLQTGDAVLYATASPSGGFGKSVGATQDFKVTIVNVGTEAASSVVAAGQSLAGVGVNATASVTVPETAEGFLGINLTNSFSVTYQDVGGTHLNATTNVVSSIFSHSSIKVGFPVLIASASINPLSAVKVNLTLTFVTSNSGGANVTGFMSTFQLPSGIGCGKVNGTGISCSGGTLSLNYTKLTIGATKIAHLQFNLTTPSSFILPPLAFTAQTSGFNMSRFSNALGIPTGLSLEKVYDPAELFGGMSSEVSVSASNAGPFPIYNLTVNGVGDSFAPPVTSAVTSKTFGSVVAGGNLNFSYGVKAAATPGPQKAKGPGASFFFAGVPYSLQGFGPEVLIYEPLSASISTSPTTPIEGKSFTIDVSISNPSGVDVSNVALRLPIPSGLTLTQLQNASFASGVLAVDYSSMGADSTFHATATAVASSGVTVPFDKATLTFSYGGATINGKLPSQGIAIGEDVTARYIIPTSIVLLVVLAVAFYVRRMASSTAPASPK